MLSGTRPFSRFTSSAKYLKVSRSRRPVLHLSATAPVLSFRSSRAPGLKSIVIAATACAGKLVFKNTEPFIESLTTVFQLRLATPLPIARHLSRLRYSGWPISRHNRFGFACSSSMRCIRAASGSRRVVQTNVNLFSFDRVTRRRVIREQHRHARIFLNHRTINSFMQTIDERLPVAELVKQLKRAISSVSECRAT